uniref:Uncharacterized protein n=1 Tax=Neisseria meningitidis alpha153 TaxID=663926 RepID=C6SAU5_NEIME|nr:hypothetical protein predicted by Glimmer/Critica [Neisseria meningitidis alpha153]
MKCRLNASKAVKSSPDIWYQKHKQLFDRHIAQPVSITEYAV